MNQNEIVENKYEKQIEDMWAFWASKDGNHKKDGVKIIASRTPMTVVVNILKCNYLHFKQVLDKKEKETTDQRSNAFQIMMMVNRK